MTNLPTVLMSCLFFFCLFSGKFPFADGNVPNFDFFTKFQITSS